MRRADRGTGDVKAFKATRREYKGVAETAGHDLVHSHEVAFAVPLLRQAGLRYRKPHTLRHTYASLLIQGGESLAYVRDRLGHHSIKLTVDMYGHLVPGANRAAVDRLDDATGRNLYETSRQ